MSLIKVTTGMILIFSFSALYVYLEQSGLSDRLFNNQSLQAMLIALGLWGPLIIVTLMTAAIVMSPIPSAPIAIASGFVYGHSWGTVYILIGAELGAIIAFSIARLLGYEAMQKRFGDQLDTSWLGSSRHLMIAVCISRLIPFISFDIVSYAAGLTRLSYLQFAIATLVGIIPASFLLAHFGSEMVSSDLKEMTLTVLLLGMVTAVSVVIGMFVKRKK